MTFSRSLECKHDRWINDDKRKQITYNSVVETRYFYYRGKTQMLFISFLFFIRLLGRCKKCNNKIYAEMPYKWDEYTLTITAQIYI